MKKPTDRYGALPDDVAKWIEDNTMVACQTSPEISPELHRQAQMLRAGLFYSGVAENILNDPDCIPELAAQYFRIATLIGEKMGRQDG